MALMDLPDLDEILADLEHMPAAAAVPDLGHAFAPMPLPLALEPPVAAPTQGVAPPVQLAPLEPQHVALPPVPPMPAAAPLPKCSWILCPLHRTWCMWCSRKCTRGGLHAIARRWRA
jgi:hypothetical protein